MHPGLAHDAVVLAGGRARRLGVPKPGVVVGDAPLLDHALAAARGARRTAVVGPDDLDLSSTPDAVLTREDPPFSGPVAGIAAGLAALVSPVPDGAPSWVLVLACDVPRAAEAVPLLLDAVLVADGAPDGGHLVSGGRAQWLVGLYRRAALEAALDRVRAARGTLDDAPVRALLAGLRLLEIEDVEGLSTDVDTWEDAEQAGRVLAGQARPRRTTGRHE